MPGHQHGAGEAIVGEAREEAVERGGKGFRAPSRYGQERQGEEEGSGAAGSESHRISFGGSGSEGTTREEEDG